MGNIINSFFSGFVSSIGKLFGTPLDFLTGKSCGSICSTWDIICLVENFCVANLLKLAMILFLSYIVLLCFYLLYQLGVYHCIGHSLCKMLWACVSSWFSLWECCCTFLLAKLLNPNRTRRRHKIKDPYYPNNDIEASISASNRWRDARKTHVRKSLRRPRSHGVRVGISRHSSASGHRRNRRMSHRIKVRRTSSFVKKGRNSKRRVHRGTAIINGSINHRRKHKTVRDCNEKKHEKNTGV